MSNAKIREGTRQRVARWRAASEWRRKTKNNEYNRRYREKKRAAERNGIEVKQGLAGVGQEPGTPAEEGAADSAALFRPGRDSVRESGSGTGSSAEERRVAEWLAAKQTPRERPGVEVELTYDL